MLPPQPVEWVFDTRCDHPVYTRRLVGSELVYQRMWDSPETGVEVCVGVNFTSTLMLEELKDRTRVAVDKLRFLCPLIACTVEDIVSPRWVYNPSNDREAWLNLAFAIEEQETFNPPHFVQSVSLKRLPYTDGNGTVSFFRTYLVATSEEGGDESKEYGLYVHGTHAVCDVGPALHALNMMCGWISGEGIDVAIEPSEEWKNLPVDPITATGGPCKEWGTAGMELLQDFMAERTRSSPCHQLAPPTSPNTSDPPFHYTQILSESDTAAIVAKSKQLGISVTTLFYAAHSLAQFKMNPIPKEETNVDFSTHSVPVSLERYLKPPVNPRTHLVSSLTIVPTRFSMAQPLAEPTEKGRLIMTAKLLQKRLDKYLDNPGLPHLYAVLASFMPAGGAPDDSTDTSDREEEEKKATFTSWATSFQNIGIVEKKLRTKQGKITVGSICIGGRFKTMMRVHMWTMNSKLYAQVQGATAWGKELMKTFLEEILRIGSLILDEA